MRALLLMFALVQIVGEQKVVFIGDSLTAQWDLTMFTSKTYVNAGIAGNTAEQVLVRFRHDVVEAGATTVVLWAGINDIGAIQGLRTNEQIESALAAICELAAANKVAVVLASLTPTRGTFLVTHPLARIQAINAWAAVYAAQHKLVYLDDYATLLDGAGVLDATLTTDGLHLNANGYQRIAPLAEAAILKTFGEGP